MKTQERNRLTFNKNGIIELNRDQLLEVEGGSSVACATAVASSGACIATGVLMMIAVSVVATITLTD